jgi:hypothetical protein
MGERQEWLIELDSKVEERFLRSRTAKNAVPPVGMTGCVVLRMEEKRRQAAALQKRTAPRGYRDAAVETVECR